MNMKKILAVLMAQIFICTNITLANTSGYKERGQNLAPKSMLKGDDPTQIVINSLLSAVEAIKISYKKMMELHAQMIKDSHDFKKVVEENIQYSKMRDEFWEKINKINQILDMFKPVSPMATTPAATAALKATPLGKKILELEQHLATPTFVNDVVDDTRKFFPSQQALPGILQNKEAQDYLVEILKKSCVKFLTALGVEFDKDGYPVRIDPTNIQKVRECLVDGKYIDHNVYTGKDSTKGKIERYASRQMSIIFASLASVGDAAYAEHLRRFLAGYGICGPPCNDKGNLGQQDQHPYSYAAPAAYHQHGVVVPKQDFYLASFWMKAIDDGIAEYNKVVATKVEITQAQKLDYEKRIKEIEELHKQGKQLIRCGEPIEVQTCLNNSYRMGQGENLSTTLLPSQKSPLTIALFSQQQDVTGVLLNPSTVSRQDFGAGFSVNAGTQMQCFQLIKNGKHHVENGGTVDITGEQKLLADLSKIKADSGSVSGVESKIKSDRTGYDVKREDIGGAGAAVAVGVRGRMAGGFGQAAAYGADVFWNEQVLYRASERDALQGFFIKSDDGDFSANLTKLIKLQDGIRKTHGYYIPIMLFNSKENTLEEFVIDDIVLMLLGLDPKKITPSKIPSKFAKQCEAVGITQDMLQAAMAEFGKATTLADFKKFEDLFKLQLMVFNLKDITSSISFMTQNPDGTYSYQPIRIIDNLHLVLPTIFSSKNPAAQDPNKCLTKEQVQFINANPDLKAYWQQMMKRNIKMFLGLEEKDGRVIFDENILKLFGTTDPMHTDFAKCLSRAMQVCELFDMKNFQAKALAAVRKNYPNLGKGANNEDIILQSKEMKEIRTGKPAAEESKPIPADVIEFTYIGAAAPSKLIDPVNTECEKLNNPAVTEIMKMQTDAKKIKGFADKDSTNLPIWKLSYLFFPTYSGRDEAFQAYLDFALNPMERQGAVDAIKGNPLLLKFMQDSLKRNLKTILGIDLGTNNFDEKVLQVFDPDNPSCSNYVKCLTRAVQSFYLFGLEKEANAAINLVRINYSNLGKGAKGEDLILDSLEMQFIIANISDGKIVRQREFPFKAAAMPGQGEASIGRAPRGRGVLVAAMPMMRGVIGRGAGMLAPAAPADTRPLCDQEKYQQAAKAALEYSVHLLDKDCGQFIGRRTAVAQKLGLWERWKQPAPEKDYGKITVFKPSDLLGKNALELASGHAFETITLQADAASARVFYDPDIVKQEEIEKNLTHTLLVTTDGDEQLVRQNGRRYSVLREDDKPAPGTSRDEASYMRGSEVNKFRFPEAQRRFYRDNSDVAKKYGQQGQKGGYEKAHLQAVEDYDRQLLSDEERRKKRAGMLSAAWLTASARGGYGTERVPLDNPKRFVLLNTAGPQFEKYGKGKYEGQLNELEVSDFIVKQGAAENLTPLFTKYYKDGKIPSWQDIKDGKAGNVGKLDAAATGADYIELADGSFFNLGAFYEAARQYFANLVIPAANQMIESTKKPIKPMYLMATLIGGGFFAKAGEAGDLRNYVIRTMLSVYEKLIEKDMFKPGSVIEFPRYGNKEDPLLANDVKLLMEVAEKKGIDIVWTPQGDLLDFSQKTTTAGKTVNPEDYSVVVLNAGDAMSFAGNEPSSASVEAMLGNDTDMRFVLNYLFNPYLLDPKKYVVIVQGNVEPEKIGFPRYDPISVENLEYNAKVAEQQGKKEFSSEDKGVEFKPYEQKDGMLLDEYFPLALETSEKDQFQVFSATTVARRFFRQPINEDEHVTTEIIVKQNGKQVKIPFFAVYDGHGGHDVSNIAAKGDSVKNISPLHKIIEDRLQTVDLKNYAAVAAAIKQAFLDFDNSLKGITAGSTALVCLVIGDKIITADLGDSRAVLVDSNNQVIQLSYDQKPGQEDETKRITAAGGSVSGGRVNYDLAVPRAFGDYKYKPFVSAEPFISMHSIPKGDYKLVLACDGVWTDGEMWRQVKNNQIPAILAATCDKGNPAAQLLLDAYNRGSGDNISVVVVNMKGTAASKKTSLTPKIRHGEPEVIQDYHIEISLKGKVGVYNEVGKKIKPNSELANTLKYIEEKVEEFRIADGFEWMAKVEEEKLQPIKIYFEKNSLQFERTENNRVYLDYDLFVKYLEDAKEVCTEALYKGLCIRLAQQNLKRQDFYSIYIVGTPFETYLPVDQFGVNQNKTEVVIKLLSHYQVREKGLITKVGYDKDGRLFSQYTFERKNLYGKLLMREINLIKSFTEEQLTELRKTYHIPATQDIYSFEDGDEKIFSVLDTIKDIETGIDKLLTELELNIQIDTAVRTMA